MTSLLALLLAAFLGALGPGPDQAGSGPVGVGDADLVLLVSNQSFDDPAASLSVDIDGRTVVAQRFDVEAQHTWIEFPLAVGPGRHTLVAESDAGHRFRQTFTLPAGGVGGPSSTTGPTTTTSTGRSRGGWTTVRSRSTDAAPQWQTSSAHSSARGMITRPLPAGASKCWESWVP